MRHVIVLMLSALVTIHAGVARGHSFVPKEFHQLVAEAEQIFVGTVTAAQSRKLPTGVIVTDVTFSSLRMLKGGEVPANIVLLVLGGSVDGETMKVGGFPEFQLGVTYLVFSKGNGTAIFPVVGGAQGLFQIRREPTTGNELVFDAYGMLITSPTATDAIGAPAPVTLDTFIQAIKTQLRP